MVVVLTLGMFIEFPFYDSFLHHHCPFFFSVGFRTWCWMHSCNVATNQPIEPVLVYSRCCRHQCVRVTLGGQQGWCNNIPKACDTEPAVVLDDFAALFDEMNMDDPNQKWIISLFYFLKCYVSVHVCTLRCKIFIMPQHILTNRQMTLKSFSIHSN